MARVLRRLAAVVLRARIPVLLLTGVVTIVLGLMSARVGFDSAVDIWFLDDAPELATYDAFKAAFGTDELLVVGIFDDDVFDNETLAHIEAITSTLATIELVHRARSITNATELFHDDDTLEHRPIRVVGTASTTRERALANPLVRDLLVAADGTAAAVVVELEAEADTFEEKVALVREVKRRAALVDERLDVRVAGTPAINEAIYRYSRRDFALLGGLALALILGIGLVAFRSVTLALLPLGVVVAAVVWIFGVMGILGLRINLVSQSLVTVVLAVGIADAIHLLTEYRARLHTEGRDEALTSAVAETFVPCAFTTLTTVAGMLSLLSSHLVPIREFGALAAAGVATALVLTFSALPAALTLLPTPPAADPARGLGGALDAMVHGVKRVRFVVLAVFVVATTFALWRVIEIRVGANPVAYFLEGDPVREDIRAIDERLGGSTSIELFVESADGGLGDPEILARLATLERWLETLPSVTRVLSVTDALESASLAMTGTATISKDRATIAQTYLLLEDEEGLGAFVDDARERGRISARVRMTDAAELVREIPAVEARLAAGYSGDELKVRPTGFVKLIGQMELYIVDSQLKSFALALVVVSLLMVVLLRSLRLGILAMIPNLVPIAGGLAVMELLGIHLDPGTAMIGSVTLGLVVDDTVHLFSRYAAEQRKGLEPSDAITIAVRQVGRALVVTSVVLALGFGVLGFGSFTPNVYFGIVASVVISLALVCDLVVVPAVVFALGGENG